MRTRTQERAQFLADLLVTAIEHMGYGFPYANEYVWDVAPEDVYAVIFDRYEEEPTGRPGWKPSQTWRVDIDTMARGIGVLRKKYSASTSDDMTALFEADRENDASITDVVGALAVLEAAIFGDVTYS